MLRNALDDDNDDDNEIALIDLNVKQLIILIIAQLLYCSHNPSSITGILVDIDLRPIKAPNIEHDQVELQSRSFQPGVESISKKHMLFSNERAVRHSQKGTLEHRQEMERRKKLREGALQRMRGYK